MVQQDLHENLPIGNVVAILLGIMRVMTLLIGVRPCASLALVLTYEKIRSLITDSQVYKDLLCARSNLSLSPLTLAANLPKHSNTGPCA